MNAPPDKSRIVGEGYVNVTLTEDRNGKPIVKLASITDRPSGAANVRFSLKVRVAVPADVLTRKIVYVNADIPAEFISPPPTIEVLVGDESIG